MDPVLRRRVLQKYLSYAHADLERELKGQEGVEKLVDVYNQSPDFGDSKLQEEVGHKLLQVYGN